MKNALPLILLAGGALLVIGGKRKDEASEEGPFDEPPPPGSSGDLILTGVKAQPNALLTGIAVEPNLLLKGIKASPAEKKKTAVEGNKAVNEEAKADKGVSPGGLNWRSGNVGDIQKGIDGNYYIYWGKTKRLPPDQRKGKHADFSKRWRKRPKKKNVKKAVAAAVLSGGGAAAHNAYVQYLLFVYGRRNRYYSNW